MSENPKRNRIVIELQSAKQPSRKVESAYATPSPKRGRLGKILAFIGGLVVLGLLCVVVGAYFWWSSYKQKPAYTIALVVDAVQRNDMKTFDTLVDTDKVVDNFMPQFTDTTTGKFASLIPPGFRKQVETLIPQVLPAVKQQVHDQVAQQVKELSERAQGKPFLLIALGIPWIATVDQKGDNANVVIETKGRVTELTMQRNGELWKIVAVKDDQMTQHILDSMKKVLPSVGTQGENNSKGKAKGNRPDSGPSLQLPSITIPGSKH
jgi:hypothetical protein